MESGGWKIPNPPNHQPTQHGSMNLVFGSSELSHVTRRYCTAYNKLLVAVLTFGCTTIQQAAILVQEVLIYCRV